MLSRSTTIHSFRLFLREMLRKSVHLLGAAQGRLRLNVIPKIARAHLHIRLFAGLTARAFVEEIFQAWIPKEAISTHIGPQPPAPYRKSNAFEHQTDRTTSQHRKRDKVLQEYKHSGFQ
jgi:acetylornithine deacetylase/succinyl-diaminopimelate desuccinylase-like protein